ncbi:acyl-homoserine-lactone acylase QuiP [Desulfatiferula olefinivorans]
MAAAFGCSGMVYRYLDSRYAGTLEPAEGEHRLAGLEKPVRVSRDNLGIPHIQAETVEDLVFASGYISAMDRLAQMIEFRLAAQGRLAEMSGKSGLELDYFLRALDIKKGALLMLDASSPELKRLLQIYCDGVNAYMDEQKRLPINIDISGYTPEAWKPVDSASVFVFLTLGLAQNLHEEIDILNMLSKVGAENMAWLIPVYPDEPLPFAEMNKLKEIDLSGSADDLKKLFAVGSRAADLAFLHTAASNNWVVSGKRTPGGASLLANDTHLPLSMPSIWNMTSLACPGYRGAGIALAGLPGIVAGFNGHVAWGMTMVMADNQDLFIEKLKTEDGALHYLYQGQWKKAAEREEIFKIKGEKPVTRIIYETVHGPLLNGLLENAPLNAIAPQPARFPFGFALSWAAFEPDATMDAFFGIARAENLDQAVATMKNITGIPLNMVAADKDNIAWLVTGRYPLRKNGTGLFPSPGWTGDYDWTGFLDTERFPREINPERGYCQSANHRTVPADYPHRLSSSWYYPERSERIAQMIETESVYTLKTAQTMQTDTVSLSAEKFKRTLFDLDTLAAVNGFIDALSETRRANAREGLALLRQFDGNMTADSKAAAFFAVFSSELLKNIFLDELGPEGSDSWNAFLDTHLLSYSALPDHMTERCRKSPFWDKIQTEKTETREEILALSLADAVSFLEEELGNNRDTWTWGRLHTYRWDIEASKMADHLGFIERSGMKFLSDYFNRGPFPAPGDHNTLNVSAYHPGKDFDTWLIPAMRIIVDFSREEPMIGINSSGQSGNPASPHYDDGIHEFLDGRYQPFPLQEANVSKHYTRTLTLLPVE